MTHNELLRMIATTESEPERFGMSGADRAALYRLASFLGLRQHELASLRPRSFNFASNPPSVMIEAADAKNRRRYVLPIPAMVAKQLRDYLSTKRPQNPDALLWPTADTRGNQMLRADLATARAAWLDEATDFENRVVHEQSTFLALVDGAGKAANFHSLRQIFIIGLCIDCN
jgi:integrase